MFRRGKTCLGNKKKKHEISKRERAVICGDDKEQFHLSAGYSVVQMAYE